MFTKKIIRYVFFLQNLSNYVNLFRKFMKKISNNDKIRTFTCQRKKFNVKSFVRYFIMSHCEYSRPKNITNILPTYCLKNNYLSKTQNITYLTYFARVT